jgi:hypothetical protein
LIFVAAIREFRRTKNEFCISASQEGISVTSPARRRIGEHGEPHERSRHSNEECIMFHGIVGFKEDDRNTLNYKSELDVAHLVVPKGEAVYVRTISMPGFEDGKKTMHFKNEKESVARMTVERNAHGHTLMLEGLHAGQTTVTAKEGAGKLDLVVNGYQLEVHVFRPIQIYVSFYLVTDANGTTNQSAARARAWLDDLNDIYGPQTNIYFRPHRTEELDLSDDFDFKERLHDKAARKQFWRALRDAVTVRVDKGPLHWNVFLVKEWGGDDTDTYDEVGVTLIGEGYSIMEDKVGHGGHAAHTLAHEAGHMLGLDHPVGPRDDDLLMTQHSQGAYLFWDEVQLIREQFGDDFK